MRKFSRGLRLAAVLLCSVACYASDTFSIEMAPVAGDDSSARQRPASSEIIDAYKRLPMSFEKNKGQADKDIDFIARGPGYRVLLAHGEATLDLASRHSDASSMPGQPPHNPIRMRFVEASPDTIAIGGDQLPGKVSYFRGADPATHLIDIENFARVQYAAIYPGIDVIYYGNQRQLEYDLIVGPGADPGRIKLAVEGADHIGIDEDGNLLLRAGTDELTFRKPVIYQKSEDDKRVIEGRYIRLADSEIGFEIAAYDHQVPLVIDPVLSYSTYLGGTSTDIGLAVAVDASGNTYLTGYTQSTSFPVLNPYHSAMARKDTQDLFVSKLNPAGTALVYSTYIGGAGGQDRATGIALDSAGNAYISGETYASDFPVTSGAYQTSAPSGGAFVTKLSPSGNTLVYSTYVLGASATHIAIDAGGAAYLTGSATGTFLTTSGAFQGTRKGENAFIAKLNATGTAMVYATFLGGTGTDFGKGIAVDGQGNAYVAGATISSDFPNVYGLQGTSHGGLEGFVSKLNPSGTALVYSTYLGGSLDDSINAIAIDAQGSVYVAGETYSADFPTRNAFQPSKAGYLLTNSNVGNAFVAKLAPSGDALAYSSFLGGEMCTSYCQLTCVLGCTGYTPAPQYPGDLATAIAVDAAGHAYVTGLARSYTFPLIDSLQPRKTSEGQDSLFVSKIGVAGNALLYSTFARTGYSNPYSLENGSASGGGNGIAVDSAGSAYVVTENDTGNGVFPTTAGAYQTTNKGSDDVVAFKLVAPSSAMTLASSANPASSQTTTTLTATVADTSLTGSVSFMDGATQLGTAPVTNGTATLTKSLAPGIRRLSAVLRINGATADSALLYQVVNAGLTCN